MGIVRLIGGDEALAAAFVIATGALGSMLGPWFLSRIRIADPVARGLAVGTTAHGQGTAMMLHEGETQGALSGVEMALAAPRSLRQSWFLGSLTYGDKAVTRNPSGRSR